MARFATASWREQLGFVLIIGRFETYGLRSARRSESLCRGDRREQTIDDALRVTAAKVSAELYALG
jgi:hypothetical protein